MLCGNVSVVCKCKCCVEMLVLCGNVSVVWKC